MVMMMMMKMVMMMMMMTVVMMMMTMTVVMMMMEMVLIMIAIYKLLFIVRLTGANKNQYETFAYFHSISSFQHLQRSLTFIQS